MPVGLNALGMIKRGPTNWEEELDRKALGLMTGMTPSKVKPTEPQSDRWACALCHQDIPAWTIARSRGGKIFHEKCLVVVDKNEVPAPEIFEACDPLTPQERVLIGRLNTLNSDLFYAVDDDAFWAGVDRGRAIRNLILSDDFSNSPGYEYVKSVMKHIMDGVESTSGIGYMRDKEFKHISPRICNRQKIVEWSVIGGEKWVTVSHSTAARLAADQFSIDIPSHAILRDGTMYYKPYYYAEKAPEEIIGLYPAQIDRMGLRGKVTVSLTLMVTKES